MAAAEPAAEQGLMGKEYPNAMRMGRFVENEISDAEIADMIRAAPAYKVLFEAGILCLDYRKQDQNEIYETTRDFMANSSQANNLVLRGKFACFYGKETTVSLFFHVNQSLCLIHLHSETSR